MSYEVGDQHHETISRMLELTRPTQIWQKELMAFLEDSISEQDLRKTLRFLQHMLSAGKTSLREYHGQQIKPGRNKEPAYVDVDFTLAPLALNIERLKNWVISLGFQVEEPDGYHKLNDVSFAVDDAVLYPVLEGMCLLISLLLEIPWEMLCMVRHLSESKAQGLCMLLQNTNTEMDTQQVSARSIMSQYPQEMKSLGFYKDHGRVKRASSSDQECHKQLILVLRALSEKEPPGLGIFI